MNPAVLGAADQGFEADDLFREKGVNRLQVSQQPVLGDQVLKFRPTGKALSGTLVGGLRQQPGYQPVKNRCRHFLLRQGQDRRLDPQAAAGGRPEILQERLPDQRPGGGSQAPALLPV